MRYCKVIFLSIFVLNTTACSEKAADVQITECDKVAANPNDPERVAAGIALDNIIPRIALEVCKQATEKYPASGRLRYQLGRAQEAYDGRTSALPHYEKATAMDYDFAYYNLALYQIEQNTALDLGVEYLGKCAKYKICRDELTRYSFNAEGLSDKEFFSKAFAGKLPNDGEKGIASYSVYMSQFLGKFNATPSCAKIVTSNMVFQFSRYLQGEMFKGMLGALRQSQRQGSLGYSEGKQFAGNISMDVSKADSDAITL